MTDFIEVAGPEFEESEFFSFKNTGDTFEGRKLSAHNARNAANGQQQRVFNFRDAAGDKWAIGGLADLAPKLERVPNGTMVKITLTGGQTLSKGTMKIFSVQVPKGTNLVPLDNIPF